MYNKNSKVSKLLYYFLFFLLYIPYKHITGVEIHPEAKIGEGLFIPHCTSIIISKSAVIGNEATIHQCTTIGLNYKTNKAPILGDNVFIGTNSSIVGGINIGDNVKVLPNSTVTKDFSKDLIIGGVPAKIIKENNILKDL
ncbi:hypothetical protein BIV60_26460 [Bacillus sp. MUM 116]|uniref:serine O-acetyltransferase n=1 Tax=Bacillus sp. MUM 116 TaxID=1678002 RepID=UPI0008F56346|nr:DapH/DapD/GlmU-related protein [Bacillus sp. MUM 116]OIK08411.1 hypothetical protein BIV60_26460 [Bacillus sp. MUM 116]